MNVQNALEHSPRRTLYCQVTQWFNIIGDYFPFLLIFASRLMAWIFTTPLLRPYNEKLWARNQKVNYEEEVSKHGDLLTWFTRDANLDLVKHRHKLSKLSDCGRSWYLSPVEATVVAEGTVDAGNNAKVLKGQFNINSLVKESRDFGGFPFMVLFLAPTDIHNCYFPFESGKLVDLRYISGRYLLTNPYAIQYCSKVYEKNFRVSFKFLLPDGSCVWIVMISANFVGVIETRLEIGDEVKFGDEVGKFYLGSTVAIVTDDKSVKWTKDRATKVKILDVL